MLWKSGSLAAMACLIAGCGTQLPELVSAQVLPMEALVAAIHCELAGAVRKQAGKPDRQFLKDWQGAYTITLRGNETGTLAADANKFPASFGSGSSVAVAAGADIKGSANRTAILKFNLNFADIRPTDALCSEGSSNGSHPFLRGRMGFREWLDTALDASLSDPTIRNHPDKLTSIAHTFQFVVISNAGLNPVFTIVPRPIVLNPSVSVSREEDNSVDVVLAKPAKSAGPTVVVKILTPRQLAQIDEAQRQRDEAKLKLEKATSFLMSADGRRVAALDSLIETKQAELTELGGAIRDRREVYSMTPDNTVPDNRKTPQAIDRAASVITSLQQLTGQLTQDRDYRIYEASKRDASEIPGTLALQQARIDRIKADPQGIRTTRASRRVIAAEDNPNIVNTSLQLTLERVLGNARVPGF